VGTRALPLPGLAEDLRWGATCVLERAAGESSPGLTLVLDTLLAIAVGGTGNRPAWLSPAVVSAVVTALGPLAEPSASVEQAMAIAQRLAATLALVGRPRSADLEPATGNDTDRPSRAAPEAVSVVDQAQLERLEQMMSVERAYRLEGLTIAALAAKLELPEYRLRQLINEGLGYRNFNAFLNHHRIEDAKAALSDPSQRDVPILTIAMDAGFQSIGPFNRAFKAGTGLTPSEFRRVACQTGRPD